MASSRPPGESSRDGAIPSVCCPKDHSRTKCQHCAVIKTCQFRAWKFQGESVQHKCYLLFQNRKPSDSSYKNLMSNSHIEMKLARTLSHRGWNSRKASKILLWFYLFCWWIDSSMILIQLTVIYLKVINHQSNFWILLIHSMSHKGVKTMSCWYLIHTRNIRRTLRKFNVLHWS